MMRLVLAGLLVAGAVVSPENRYFRYERPVAPPSATAGQTCAGLPPEVFAHAQPGLADVRLYRGTTEVPFVIRVPEPVQARPGALTPLNLGERDGKTVFDVPMPTGTYSDVELGLSGENFIGTVAVSGSETRNSPNATKLGNFTIFDLSGQRLGRSTVLHLPETDLGYLHFAINGPIRPQQVEGVELPSQPASETSYTTVATNTRATQEGRTSVVELSVPAHVPVDRVAFVPGAEPAAFSRSVTITVRPSSARAPVTDESAPPPEPTVFSGSLLRLHRKQDGQQIDEERLTVGISDQQSAAPSRWTIAIENGDDAPLRLQAVRLEMQERDLCFDAASRASYTLSYDDPSLPAPQYDYAALFAAQQHATRVSLGPEVKNQAYTARPDTRPFTERHPGLLWIALVAAICLLGGVALRSGMHDKAAG